ncbi:MAG TPA: hypothetical protein VMV69_10555 [Pirellulales bacterium]|nr:hypothetical protein [Pirellulales bacterium]
MHTVDLLEQALRAATQLGYGVRQEWLGGSGGGSCEIKGRKWIFLDLALSLPDQLEQVAEALRREPAAACLPLTPALGRLVAPRKAA